MKKKRLMVRANSLKDSLKRFKNVWERAEKGEKFDVPIEVLSFENTATLIKTLSPKRLELLQMLHALGGASIRKLAKELDRDYSNVYQDVKSLHRIGVILEKEGVFFVPWETIVTEFPLCTKQSPKHVHRGHDKSSAA